MVEAELVCPRIELLMAATGESGDPLVNQGVELFARQGERLHDRCFVRVRKRVLLGRFLDSFQDVRGGAELSERRRQENDQILVGRIPSLDDRGERRMIGVRQSLPMRIPHRNQFRRRRDEGNAAKPILIQFDLEDARS